MTTLKQSIRRLEILRDEVLPSIPKGKLDMAHFTTLSNYDGPMCLLGWAKRDKHFEGLAIMDVLNISLDEYITLFSHDLPNDRRILRSNINAVIASKRKELEHV